MKIFCLDFWEKQPQFSVSNGQFCFSQSRVFTWLSGPQQRKCWNKDMDFLKSSVIRSRIAEGICPIFFALSCELTVACYSHSCSCTVLTVSQKVLAKLIVSREVFLDITSFHKQTHAVWVWTHVHKSSNWAILALKCCRWFVLPLQSTTFVLQLNLTQLFQQTTKTLLESQLICSRQFRN